MVHESTALFRSAQHHAISSHSFCRKDSGQHVVVIGDDEVSIGFLAVRETEEVDDQRRVHHLLLRPPLPAPQRIEKVHVVLARPPSRNASERVTEPNSAISTTKYHAIVVVRSDLAGICSHHAGDAMIIGGTGRSGMPPRVQTQPYVELRPRRGRIQALRHDPFDVP